MGVTAYLTAGDRKHEKCHKVSQPCPPETLPAQVSVNFHRPAIALPVALRRLAPNADRVLLLLSEALLRGEFPPAGKARVTTPEVA